MVNVQTKVAPSIIGGNTRPSSICVFCPLLQHKADEIYERLTERVNGVAYTYLVAPVLFVDLLDTGLERMRPFTLYTSLGSRVFLSLPLKRSRTRCQYPINCGGLSFRQWWWTPPHSPPAYLHALREARPWYRQPGGGGLWLYYRGVTRCRQLYTACFCTATVTS